MRHDAGAHVEQRVRRPAAMFHFTQTHFGTAVGVGRRRARAERAAQPTTAARTSRRHGHSLSSGPNRRPPPPSTPRHTHTHTPNNRYLSPSYRYRPPPLPERLSITQRRTPQGRRPSVGRDRRVSIDEAAIFSRYRFVRPALRPCCRRVARLSIAPSARIDSGLGHSVSTETRRPPIGWRGNHFLATQPLASDRPFDAVTRRRRADGWVRNRAEDRNRRNSSKNSPSVHRRADKSAAKVSPDAFRLAGAFRRVPARTPGMRRRRRGVFLPFRLLLCCSLFKIHSHKKKS